MIARRSRVVGGFAGSEGGFGGDENLVAPAFDGHAENFLGQAIGVHVGRVEHGEAAFEADIDHAGGFSDISGAKAAEDFVAATESAGAEGEKGNF